MSQPNKHTYTHTNSHTFDYTNACPHTHKTELVDYTTSMFYVFSSVFWIMPILGLVRLRKVSSAMLEIEPRRVKNGEIVHVQKTYILTNTLLMVKNII